MKLSYHGMCKALANGMVGMPEASQMGGMGGSVGGSMGGRQMGGAGAPAPGVPQQIPGAQLLFAVGGLQRANSPLWTAEVFEVEHGWGHAVAAHATSTHHSAAAHQSLGIVPLSDTST